MKITKVGVPRGCDVYRDENGNLYAVGFDTCAENPVELWDNAELCVLVAPRGERLNDPGDSDCDALWELDAFRTVNGRLPTTGEWGRLCSDYHVLIKWVDSENRRLVAVALPKAHYPIDLTEDLVEQFSKWADGYAYYVQPVDGPVECTIAPVYATSAEDALRECIENGYFG